MVPVWLIYVRGGRIPSHLLDCKTQGNLGSMEIGRCRPLCFRRVKLRGTSNTKHGGQEACSSYILSKVYASYMLARNVSIALCPHVGI